MKPKDGKPGKAVAPAAPEEALDADVADPGEGEEIKKEQIEKKKGKYGSQEVKPFKPAEAEEEEEEEKTWIEIELIGEDDEPIPGEKYKIEMPDGSVAQGTLDGDGLARKEGIDPGTCKISFPDLDQDAWEPA